MENNNIDKNIIELALKAYVYMSYAGINIVKEITENEEELIPTYKIWITVPEKSELKKQNDDSTYDINTSDGLAKSAKIILDSLYKASLESRFNNICEEEKPNDLNEIYKNLLSEYENNKNKYFRIFYKVREGDIWNEEKHKKLLRL